MQDRTTLVAIAAILYFATGLGYSIGNVPVTGYLIRNRTLPTFGGIRLYGDGFFDHQGINWVIAASLLLNVLGIGFIPVGYWLWNSMKIGGIAALILFPIVIALFLGAGAPIPLLVEPLKIILVLIAWSSLI